MYAREPANTATSAALLAFILAGQKINRPKEELDELAGRYFGEIVTNSYFVDADTLLPRYYVAHSESFSLVSILGVESNLQAVRVFSRFSDTGSDESWLGAHTGALAGTQAMYADIVAGNWNLNNRHVTISGYSYGGMAAQVLAYRLSLWNTSNTYKVVTFGSPRTWFDSRYQVHSRSILYRSPDCARWMMFSDPLVFLPFRYEEAPTYHVAWAFNPGIEGHKWKHWGEGVLMRFDGLFESQWMPNTVSSQPGASLAGWATGLLQAPVERHQIEGYAIWLNRFMPERPLAMIIYEVDDFDSTTWISQHQCRAYLSPRFIGESSIVAMICVLTSVETHRAEAFSVRFFRLNGDELFGVRLSESEADALQAIGRAMFHRSPRVVDRFLIADGPGSDLIYDLRGI